ncbi:diacylglycerol kinase [Planctomicrobium piriforme]|uniref:Diacylglycerol kinase n=1 Tax=Planctomicrobium piriforme TaxID=1576369 RepID=A0A1I3J1F0_9PLAN|nr:diacylglycerol kinase [Planctomicrobium piriforme]SFI54054.1 Diacylglycerol kinase [Planctomicrobium piriforme]
MTTELFEEPRIKARRPAWRQRLVDAESGLREGIRADSTLFAFFFCAGVVVLTSIVLGLERWEWAILVLSLGFAFSAELLHQVLKQATAAYRRHFDAIFRLGTAAVVVAHLTAFSVSAILLWPHFSSLWRS